MGQLIRTLDWSRTPLGPVEKWSTALQTTLRIMLANRFPHILWWGAQYIQLYNDAYIPIPGAKHPDKALGRPAKECWSEIWQIIGPLIDRPFQGGPATWNEDIILEIDRHGFVEETHFTIAYSPVPDETAPGGIGGVLATVHEITGKVVGDRRVLVLRDLGARSAEARNAEEACVIAARTLAAHAADVPFALLYLIDANRTVARLAGTAGAEPGWPISPISISLQTDDGTSAWPLAHVLKDEKMQVVEDVVHRFAAPVPSGPWSDPPHTAVVVPIRSNRAHHLSGFLVAGVSARLQFDDRYSNFLDLISSQIATAIANAREYEEGKKRAEALAEIDRAKTVFFSNVSHEFRTPLTLMLGPIEELLSRSHTELPPAATGQLEMAHRNSLRLLRLVNTLLDFSRIEAGRIGAHFEPTDLPAFTAELASVFRAATERAGLKLVVDCPKLTEPVYVDRDMWEKIVLNLISNAFKFTIEGEIEVTLKSEDAMAVLRVRDTGLGIPAEEMPKLFERFHRIETTQGRTHEGSGIGLALVQELVKLHGGAARAESRLGEGTTFIVSVPLGKSHLASEHIGTGRAPASTSTGAAPYVEEALRWLPEATTAAALVEDLPKHEVLATRRPSGNAGEGRPLVVIADDNADMRQYAVRLLAERYRVVAVPDGRALLEAAREHHPDLVLTDVMMPHLDGMGVVRELRADPALRTVPVILLSARAGEESRVEGMEQGADDYIVKPFSARELQARVAAHLEMARMRKQAAEQIRQAQERFRALVTATSDAVYRLSPDWREMLDLDGRELIPDTKEASSTWLQKYVHPDDQQSVRGAIDEAIRTKTTFELEHRVLRVDGSLAWTFSRAVPIQNAQGQIVEWFGAATDITKRKEAEEALRRSEERFRIAAQAAGFGTYDADLVCDRVYWSPEMRRILGIPSDVPPAPYPNSEFIHPDDAGKVAEMFTRALDPYGDGVILDEHRIIRPDGSVHWVHLRGQVQFTEKEGVRHPNRNAGVLLDITERKEAEERLLRAQKLESLGVMAGGVAHDFNNLLVGVIGNASLIEEMLPAAHPAMELVQQVSKSGEQLAHLTRQMLAYSGKGQFFLELLNLSDVVRNISDLVHPSIPKKVVLQFDLDENLPGIEADRGQVQQVLMNLMINAAEAIGDHDGLITIRTEARILDQENSRFHPQAVDVRPGKYVVLEVSDTGAGMDESVRAKIFDPFFTTKFAGRGLGLAAVSGIIRGHNGGILVSSAPGEGSAFSVFFPAATKSAEQTPGWTQQAVVRGSGVVLIVDDEQVVRDTARKALEHSGYEVLLAGSGIEAIDLFKCHPDQIDLVILDLSMPGMSGEEAMPELKKIRPKAKVLISSGYSETQAMRLFKGQEVCGFVQKPYTAASLTEKVRFALA
jgi:PAS domain S-box-containing protein